MAKQGLRIEKDSMGELEVPANALWGAQTQRAVDNFPVSGLKMPRGFIRALGLIKATAAQANVDLKQLKPKIGQAITVASMEVAGGEHDDQFPIDVFQTGSGTSSNMNANEVIAALAARRLGRPVHPNDHVNASQSSHAVFPTAMHLAAVLLVYRNLLSALSRLAGDLKLPLIEARNHFEAAGGRDALVEASGMLRTVAVGLYKICNDLRLMNSGPRTGLAEIVVPELQPGSSIMPGKVNPVIC